MAPPDKPEKGPDDLAEVERALSVLKGRHPEHERARREADAAKKKRADEQSVERAKAARADLSRRFVLLGGIVAGVILLGVVLLALQKESRRRSNITASSEPFLARGFDVVDTSKRATPGRVEADVAAGCVLAVEAPDLRDHATGPLALAIGDQMVRGPGPILTCTCAPAHVTVTSESPHGGLTLLRTGVGLVGGTKAFGFLPFAVGTKGETDAACQDAELDTWIEAKHAPTATVDTSFLEARAPLREVGFETVATAKKDLPFAVLEPKEDSCLLAVSTDPNDALRLRLRGSAEVMAAGKGSLAVCGPKLPVFVLAHDRTGEVAVVVAPAARVGGIVGVREVAEAAGITLGASAVPNSDFAWSAKQLLVASAVPEALITTTSTPELEKQPESRIVAVMMNEPGALVADGAQGVFQACSPSLDDADDAVCAFSGPHVWRTATKTAVAGIARARRPFWLFAMEGVADPGALRAEVEMVTFTRKLARKGFEPTTLEALTETPNGADVLGRTHEDAIVAVSVARTAPYLFPLTDGPAWSITGDPWVVAIKQLQKVSLRALRPLPSAQEHRRTVVYRHRIPGS